ncbi:MAG: hypothetical protein WEB88_04445 [Gemmatimonadota bacterium]
MKTLLPAVLLLAGLAACAGNPAPPAPAPFDPLGAYDFSTNVDGTLVSGTLTVTDGTSGLRGTVTTDVTEPLRLSSVRVDERTVTGSGSTPDGPFSITMTVAEDGTITGGWSLGAMSGSVTGRKRSG